MKGIDLDNVIDADDMLALELNDELVRMDFCVAQRVTNYFINHGHVECAVVVDAFAEGGMGEMLTAAVNNGDKVRMICHDAFLAAGKRAAALFEAELAKHIAWNGNVALHIVQRALGDLKVLEGGKRRELVESVFGGIDPLPEKKVA